MKHHNEFDQNDDPARSMCCWGLHVLSIDLENLSVNEFLEFSFRRRYKLDRNKLELKNSKMKIKKLKMEIKQMFFGDKRN